MEKKKKKKEICKKERLGLLTLTKMGFVLSRRCHHFNRAWSSNRRRSTRGRLILILESFSLSTKERNRRGKKKPASLFFACQNLKQLCQRNFTEGEEKEEGWIRCRWIHSSSSSSFYSNKDTKSIKTFSSHHLRILSFFPPFLYISSHLRQTEETFPPPQQKRPGKLCPVSTLCSILKVLRA